MLAEQFAAVAMFADTLKFEGAVALQSQGEGPLVRSLAECRNKSDLRGIAHLDEEFLAGDNDTPSADDHDLRNWLGGGQLALSLLPDDRNAPPHQGLIEQVHASLAANLEAYFQQSEQLPTKLFFGHTTQSGVPSVTALLLQRLPNEDTATDVAIGAADDAWHTICVLADTLEPEELATIAPNRLLNRLFNELPCRIYEPRELQFKCTCNRQKTDRTLRMLPDGDLESLLLEQNGEITVDCDFCGARYTYDEVDIAALNTSDSATSAFDGDQLH